MNVTISQKLQRCTALCQELQKMSPLMSMLIPRYANKAKLAITPLSLQLENHLRPAHQLSQCVGK